MILKHLLSALLALLLISGCKPNAAEARQPYVPSASSLDASADHASVVYAFQHKKSGVQVQGSGRVVKLLADDEKGARHQRFLVHISAQQTLLFAHNMDLAPKIPLKTGDTISFSGEYIYNPKGGVVHWTHLASKADHASGWVMLDGVKYQ